MSDPPRPFAPAAQRNRGPILEVLREVFADRREVLEIGSGSGEHAVHFAAAMPWLVWHTSDLPEHHPGIIARLREEGGDNVRPPRVLDVGQPSWPELPGLDAAFSANTAHIMSWAEVQSMFRGLGRMLPAGGPFCLYGPFNVDGAYTSPSNREFDRQLQQLARHMGVRDVGDLERLGAACGLRLETRREMPANNLLLIWRRE